MMTPEDRIKLALKMELFTIERKPPYANTDATMRLVYPNGCGQVCNEETIDRFVPDPENDANDDYAVLEWMRSDRNKWRYQFLPELTLTNNGVGTYQKGDYARACLKVIDND